MEHQADTQPVVATVAKADPTKRFIAIVIDGAVAAVLGLIPYVGYLLGGIYWLVKDGLDVDFIKHRSLGKKLLKLAVVRNDGQPMDIGTSVRRNWMFALGLVVSFLAIIPILGWMLIPIVFIAAPIIILVEAYLAYSDPQGRRWGDKLAGTTVIETSE